MPMSTFLADLRARLGHALLVLPSASACVFDDDGRLLIARHEGGIWALPGGGIEPDESPADAAVREVREELGVRVAVRALIDTYGGPEFRVHYPNGDKVSYVTTVYACRLVEGTITPDGVEVDDARFAREDELAGLTMASWSPLVLPRAFAWWREHGKPAAGPGDGA